VLLFNQRQAKKYHQPMSSKNVQAGVCQNIARTDTRSKIVSIDVDKKKLIENDFRIVQKQLKKGNSAARD